jgi:hypothetical protein
MKLKVYVYVYIMLTEKGCERCKKVENKEMINMSLFKKLLENLGWFAPEPEIAVLIDAENISPNIAKYAIEQACQMGSVRIIRAFGDWTAINPPGYNCVDGIGWTSPGAGRQIEGQKKQCGYRPG